MPKRAPYGLTISFLMFLGLIMYGLAVKSDSYNIQEGPLSASKEASETQIKNIILMIGDGMGFGQVKLGRWVEVGNGSGSLSMEQLPFWLNVTTHSADAEITDSAAGAT
ncbi:MAG: alkaline phosphatase, partial [Candidatus Hodarchaeales archaeon]